MPLDPRIYDYFDVSFTISYAYSSYIIDFVITILYK